jgi:hypothetical protein
MACRRGISLDLGLDDYRPYPRLPFSSAIPRTRKTKFLLCRAPFLRSTTRNLMRATRSHGNCLPAALPLFARRPYSPYGALDSFSSPAAFPRFAAHMTTSPCLRRSLLRSTTPILAPLQRTRQDFLANGPSCFAREPYSPYGALDSFSSPAAFPRFAAHMTTSPCLRRSLLRSTTPILAPLQRTRQDFLANGPSCFAREPYSPYGALDGFSSGASCNAGHLLFSSAFCARQHLLLRCLLASLDVSLFSLRS